MFDAQLKDQVRNFIAWNELPAQAEAYGMAPLLWHHLRRSSAKLPVETERVLRGLYLRHRLNNQISAAALIEILEIFGAAGIQPVILKGLAMAYEYYPDPALRPFCDIDLLFKQNEVLPAVHLLADAGFQVEFPSSKRIPKSIIVIAPVRAGVRVNIEAHHYDPSARLIDGSHDEEFKGFDSPPVPVTLDDKIFYAPTPQETLLYLSRHFVHHFLRVTSEHPLQLKWVADIISVVERHANSLDWSDLQKNHPDLLNRLEVFYSLTPMPEALRGIIPVPRISPPVGCGQYPNGWPHYKIGQWKRFGFRRFLRRTFTPRSAWWLRLYYGIDEKRVFWYRLAHPLYVFKLVFWAVIDAIGWFKE